MAKKAEQTTHLWAVIQEWLDHLPYPPSQNRLAERIGVEGTAVSQWKWGQSRPTPKNLRALADEMQAVAGVDVYDRLLAAVNLDMGYDVPPAPAPRKPRRAAG